MLKLRLLVAGVIAWLFLLYNVERIDGGVNIATFVYFLSAGLAIATVTWHRLTTVWVLALFGLSLVLLLNLKSLWGYGILGPALTNTVTEIGCLAFTLFLSRRVARCIETFEEGAVDVMTMQLQDKSQSMEVNQGEMYRELRRARHFKRPLTMVALSPTEKSLDFAINRMVEVVQRETTTKYVNGKISNILGDAASGLGTVALHDEEQFFLMLPESDSIQTQKIVDSISKTAKTELGLSFSIGQAAFPDEEITLVGLLDRAVSNMEQDANGGPEKPQESPSQNRPSVSEENAV